MTLREFQRLDDKTRILVSDLAVCLMGRADDRHYILLFQLDSFYLEVFYNKAERTITCIDPFDDMERLDPYLQEVELTLPW